MQQLYFIKCNSDDHMTHASTGKTVVAAFDYRNFRKKAYGISLSASFRSSQTDCEIMLRIEKVQEKDRSLLWNINQKYLYEMTNFYDDPMDENGNYHYGHFDEYFSDPRRVAYFIYNDGDFVGFAMICPYSNIEQNPDYTMAEFTIFSSFRRKHLALDAAKMILDRHPGK